MKSVRNSVKNLTEIIDNCRVRQSKFQILNISVGFISL